MRRRLDQELVRRGLVDTRARAQQAIEAGRVLVSGAVADRAARMVDNAEPIALEGPPSRFVSRGGEKLDAALERFALDVGGRRCLDVGASTGGFTDCLLQRGAASVVAVDVGAGQLDWSLRTDPRVTVLEKTNARSLTPAAVGGPCDVVVGDLSFISLRVVAPALVAVAQPGAPAVLLVKPQFEAGREQVGKGGVVRDPAVHRSVLRAVAAGLDATGLGLVAVMPSPLRGPAGNVEFLGLFLAGRAATAGPHDLDAAVSEAVAAGDGR